jgi:hypothetical protein
VQYLKKKKVGKLLQDFTAISKKMLIFGVINHLRAPAKVSYGIGTIR